MTDSIEIQCTETQLKAIESPITPNTLLNIIAGPGAGKTKTLVDRIAYALNLGLDPKEIQVFSLTKKTVEDFKLKLVDTMGYAIASQVNVSTFHSFCYRLLAEKEPDIYKFNPSNRFDPDFLRKFFNVKSHIKIDYASYENDLLKYDFAELLTSKYVPKKDRVFYDKIILEASKIVENKEVQVLESCKLIIIDEFQDVSSIIMHFLRQICKSKHLTISGDIDQSIYEFTGAFPMKNWGVMDSLYNEDNRKDILLETTFRLPENLIKVSTNTLHSPRILLSPGIMNETNIKPYRVIFSSSEEELNFIYNEVDKLITESNGKIKSKNIAILSHSNASVSTIANFFSAKNKYPVLRLKDKPLWASTPLSMILDFFKILDNINDDESMISVCRHLHLVGPTALLKLKNTANSLGKSIYSSIINHPNKFTAGQLKLFKQFFNYIKEIEVDKNNAESIMINLLRFCKQTNLRNKLGTIPEFKIELDLQEIYSDLKILEKCKPEGENLLNFFIDNYDQTQFYKQVVKSKDIDNCITISTIHTSKGREWDIVFITTLLSNFGERIQELSNSPQCNYVGVTRAKHLLYYNRFLHEPLQYIDTRGPIPSPRYKGTLKYLPKLEKLGKLNELNTLPEWETNRNGIDESSIKTLVNNMTKKPMFNVKFHKLAYKLIRNGIM